MKIGLPCSLPRPTATTWTPAFSASLAASSGNESWSSPSVISTISLAPSPVGNDRTAVRIASPIRVPPRDTESVSMPSTTRSKNAWSWVSGHIIAARPANATRPIRSPPSWRAICLISILARASRLGSTSAASIDLRHVEHHDHVGGRVRRGRGLGPAPGLGPHQGEDAGDQRDQEQAEPGHEPAQARPRGQAPLHLGRQEPAQGVAAAQLEHGQQREHGQRRPHQVDQVPILPLPAEHQGSLRKTEPRRRKASAARIRPAATQYG